MKEEETQHNIIKRSSYKSVPESLTQNVANILPMARNDDYYNNKPI